MLPANVRLDWKVLVRYKHSSLFGLIISNDEKKFYNIDTRKTSPSTKTFLMTSTSLAWKTTHIGKSFPDLFVAWTQRGKTLFSSSLMLSAYMLAPGVGLFNPISLMIWGLYYKTFYGRNLQIFIIS